MKRTGSQRPRAREEGLAVQELMDEVLVYDLERHRAHCLNKPAAMVWRHCDGKTTVARMARILHEELETPADQELVLFALDRLRKAHLLQDRSPRTIGAPGYSRREFVKRLRNLGLAATVALPVVSSIVSPTPAHAMSCVQSSMCGAAGDCVPCFIGSQNQCDSFMCCNGTCRSMGQAQSSCGC